MFTFLKNRFSWLSAIALLALMVPAVHAVEDAGSDGIKPELTSEDLVSDGTKSGYQSTASLESPGGVIADLEEADAKVDPLIRSRVLDGAFDPWFDFKRMLHQKYGLQLGFHYNLNYQYTTETDTGFDDAAGGRFQFQGMWNLIDRKGKNAGGISFQFQDRHKLGTDVTPTQLGSQFGSMTITGTGFSDFDFALTELAWRQNLLDGDLKLSFGKIAATTWYNTHALSSALTGYQNSSIRTSGAKPFPGRGIGGVVAYRAMENLGFIAGIHDANGVTSGNPFDTIDKGEFYYSAEMRFLPTSIERARWDNVRAQLWYQDERTDKGTPAGYGGTFLASRLFDDRYMPFFLCGISDGKATYIRNDATIGIAFAFNAKYRAARDVVGVGLNWGDPSQGGLDYQYSSELFYRIQLFKNIQFTPALQYILNPSFSPTTDSAVVGSLRARMTF